MEGALAPSEVANATVLRSRPMKSCNRLLRSSERVTRHSERAASRVIGTQTTNDPGHTMRMPLTIFDFKGIPATRRERIEAAVEAGGKHVAESYEDWIAADAFRGGVRVLITGPLGFEIGCVRR